MSSCTYYVYTNISNTVNEYKNCSSSCSPFTLVKNYNGFCTVSCV